MNHERPAPVLVLSLSGLLVGGAGLASAGTAATVCWALSGPGSPGTVVPLLPSTAEHLRQELAGFRAFESLLPALIVLLAGLIVGSALALLTGRPWARTAALVTAGAVLLTLFLVAVYASLGVMPTIERWHEQGFRQNVQQAQVPQLLPAEVRWVSLALLIGGLLFFVHAVATLVVLFSPTVVEEFQRGTRAESVAGR